jgi:hypothetical protein
LATVSGGVPEATGPLGLCTLVYMSNFVLQSPTLGQHLLDVEEVLEIFSYR